MPLGQERAAARGGDGAVREQAAAAGPPAPTGRQEQDQHAPRTPCRPRLSSTRPAAQLILKRSVCHPLPKPVPPPTGHRPLRARPRGQNGASQCPQRRSSWARVWKRMREDANTALAEAGADVSVPEKVTLHSLRDFYATTLITKRENVKTVQVRLGHSKPSITLDKYVGFWPTDEDTTAAAIESVPGGPEQGADLKPSALVVPSQSALGSRAPS
ncbi:tyrosine-type recombinase/integrase [Streptomyces sp. NBC_00390]